MPFWHFVSIIQVILTFFYMIIYANSSEYVLVWELQKGFHKE